MIQTVTGAIPKPTLQNALMHEHITCSSSSFAKAFGSAWLDKEKLKALSCETLKLAKEIYRLDLLIDGTPIDLGRDIRLLKEVSEASCVSIVASTGFYYLQSIEAMYNSSKELAKWLIRECKSGIEGTDIKPGILKCATGKTGITADNQKKLSTMGTVQKETGLPLYVHCDHKSDIARKQLYILLETGANIEKIIIGHTAIRPEVEYLESLLNMGCYICMDQCHCYPHNLTAIAGALAELCKKGYTNKLLVANDYCIHSDFRKIERNGLHLDATKHAENLGYVFNKLYQAFLFMGGTEKDWNTMLCTNPVDVLDV